MTMHHIFGKRLVPAAMSIVFCLDYAGAVEIQQDLQCSSGNQVCEVGNFPVTILGAAVGQSLDIDVTYTNNEYIRLLAAEGRIPGATVDVEFAISNSSASDLGIGFDAYLDLVGKTGELLTQGLVHNSGTVDRGIIDITFNPLINVPPVNAYGLRIRVETECIGTRGRCTTFDVRAGRDNINGPVRFNRAVLGVGLVLGDMNGDSVLSATDIDLISSQLGTNDPAFDLNGDNQVDQADRRFWVEELAKTYFGDANLNRSVEFRDFLALSANFDKPGGWAQGNFDGIGNVAFADFLMLSDNFGMSSAAAPVPEPSTALLLLIGAGSLLPRRHHIMARLSVGWQKGWTSGSMLD